MIVTFVFCKQIRPLVFWFEKHIFPIRAFIAHYVIRVFLIDDSNTGKLIVCGFAKDFIQCIVTKKLLFKKTYFFQD